MRLSHRAEKMKPSPTLALAAKAKELKAQGHDVISLSVGEPDWQPFEAIKTAGIKSIQDGYHGYTPAAGIPELRQAVAEQISKDVGVEFKNSEVMISSGAKFLIFAGFQMLLEPGDEVIIPAPYWASYPTMVELAEACPVIVQCDRDQKYKMNAEQLRSSITEKTRMLVLNSPSNPTGEVYSKQELKALAEVLREHPEIAILSDDIYNRLVFTPDGLAPHLLHVAPELRQQMLLINGASKSYAMTGWRVGWAIGDSHLIKAMTDYQSQSVTCASHISQRAALTAVRDTDEEMKEARVLLRQRRDLVYSLLSEIPGIQVTEPQGAFYIWPDISSFFGHSYKSEQIKDSRDFARIYLDEFKVGTIPGADFGLDGFIRISYVVEESRMREAIDRLKSFLSQLV